ncbi:hypothetical protein [Leptospira interrogans]|uniref:hypothetical protein n=1 Tax=Leptospira interrogans TaxID=173 RepID=UPI0012F7ABB1|nr:hypothetical protein [Leptospira interrogans]
MNRVGKLSTTLFMNRVGKLSTTLFMNRVGKLSTTLFMNRVVGLVMIERVLLSSNTTYRKAFY